MYKIFDAIGTIIKVLGHIMFMVTLYLSGLISFLSGLLLTIAAILNIYTQTTENIDRLTLLFYLTIGSSVLFYVSRQFLVFEKEIWG